MSFQTVNVLVTDDHTLFRKGTMKLIESFPEIGEVYEAENGEEALKILAVEDIQLILLDYDMPVLNGFETAKRIVKKYPDCYIIMVSMYDNLKTISDLIEIGVHSYLLKNSQLDEVHLAIKSVMTNQFYYNQLVSKALRAKLVQDIAINEESGLTKREIEIVELICAELTMKEIGEKLCISEQTVLTHRKNLMKKIQARNAVSIVRYALHSGIIQM